MRYYTYKCWPCDVEIHLGLGVEDQRMPPPAAVCPGCWDLVEQDYTTKNVQNGTLEAYIERNFCQQPIEVTTKRQRDDLCARYGTTYETGQFVRKAPRIAWEKDLTWEKAKHIARQNENMVPGPTGTVDDSGSERGLHEGTD